MNRRWLAPLALLVVSGVLAVALSARAQDGGKKTIGPGSCGSGPCHDQVVQWWQSDAHFATAQPFIDQSGKYSALASRLKISLSDAAAVNKKCMTCHGTVLSGSEKKLVEEGVSCESCHGPAGAWREAHQDKTSSYGKLEASGMARVDQSAARAKICVDCHYIVDQELLRAGHPYGWGKDDVGEFTGGLERRIGQKSHWNKKAITPADKDPAPFLARITAKGDVPNFPPPEGLPTSGGGGGGGERIVYVERDCGGGGGGGRSSIFFPTGSSIDLFLPEFMVSLEPDSIGASVMHVQDRIEMLYRVLAGGAP